MELQDSFGSVGDVPHHHNQMFSTLSAFPDSSFVWDYAIVYILWGLGIGRSKLFAISIYLYRLWKCKRHAILCGD